MFSKFCCTAVVGCLFFCFLKFSSFVCVGVCVLQTVDGAVFILLRSFLDVLGEMLEVSG